MNMFFEGMSGGDAGAGGLSLLIHSNQSSLLGESTKEMVVGAKDAVGDILSSIKGNPDDHGLGLQRE